MPNYEKTVRQKQQQVVLDDSLLEIQHSEYFNEQLLEDGLAVLKKTRVVFAVFDPKTGAFGSKVDLNKLNLNHIDFDRIFFYRYRLCR